MLSLICAWINGWVNNRDAGDLRRHGTDYYVIVMQCKFDKYHLVMVTEDTNIKTSTFPWVNTRFDILFYALFSTFMQTKKTQHKFWQKRFDIPIVRKL